MLPGKSVCLDIPRTGTTWTNRFFNAADWLELKRACGWRQPNTPGRRGMAIANSLKRQGFAFGNLNCLVERKHTGFSALPEAVRNLPKLCTLRDVESWYCSHYLYYTRSMTGTLLERTIRLLVEDRELEPDAGLREAAGRYRREFLERFRHERAGADSIGAISVRFLVWFMATVKRDYMLKRLTGLQGMPGRMGFLSFRAIVLLFENPARVLAKPGGELRRYFAEGRHAEDLRCDYFLPFEALADELRAVMIDELGYSPDIVHYLGKRSRRRNASPGACKPRVMRELASDGLIDRIRDDEWIYRHYLLPLAGRHPDPRNAGEGRAAAAPGRLPE